MLIRRGRLQRRSVIFSAILLCICISFYFICYEVVNFVFDTTRKFASSSKHRNENVVIAHYIGKGNLLGDLNKEDFKNTNLFNPIEGEGKDGRPVVIPPRELLKMQQLFQINRFNLLASDRMPLNRSLLDYRKKRCVSKKYPDDLPTTSIIIVFHNEAWSVLLRTVWSIINRSPNHLVNEILLIDDASERDFLKAPLDEYVKKLPVHTRVLRLNTRKGLIAARLLGAEHSSGDVLTFLDAHCECSTGWLEPLLARVKEDRTNVVCPVIDIISDDNFQYIKSFEMHWGAFSWEMHFRWYLMNSTELNKRSSDVSKPFHTPAMAGGLFSIDKNYFYDIGAYDSKMKIWGGENLEMSFRIWQCGGRIEIAPCSHVGHLFRKSSPYTFPGGVNEILNENLARTALVWMDDWSKFFFKYFRISKNLTDSLDVQDRIELRRNLHCKSFEWYLNTIWPDNFFPNAKRFFGKIIHVDIDSPLFQGYLKIIKKFDSSQEANISNIILFLNSRIPEFKRLLFHLPLFCLQKAQQKSSIDLPYGEAVVSPCANNNVLREIFVIKENGQITTNEGICIDARDSQKNSSKAFMINCADTPRQTWNYDLHQQQFVRHDSKNCLTVKSDIQKVFDEAKYSSNRKAFLRFLGADVDGKNIESVFHLNSEACSDGNMRQKWMLLPLSWI